MRTTGLLPLLSVLEVTGYVQTLALAAALFGIGTGMHLAFLVRRSGRALLFSPVSTLAVAGVAFVVAASTGSPTPHPRCSVAVQTPHP